MTTSISSRRLRGIVAVYLVAVAAVTAAFALAALRSAHPWILGEWLINDAGGLVRRGLCGSALLGLSRALHLPLLPLLSAVQLLLYATWYVAVYALTRGVRWSLLLVAALFSPATLAFTVLDPPSSVRKEALLFVALALLLLWLRRSAVSGVWVAAYLAAVAPLLVLVHEGLLVFLPYLFAPLFLVWGWRSALRRAAVPALLSALAAAVVFTHPGDRAHAEAICAALARDLPSSPAVRLNPAEPGGLCNGAIAYLAMTSAAARAETVRAVRFYHYDRIYPMPAALALLPAALLLWRRWRKGPDEARRRTGVVVLTCVVSLLLSIPLFLVARDWGRWVHIHATAMLLLCLALEGTAEGRERPLELPVQHPRLALLAVVVYATSWTLPAVGIFPGRFGYLDLIRYLRGYRETPHLAAPPVCSSAVPDC